MVSQGRCLTLPFTLVRESADCPSLRASSQSPTSFSKGGLVDPRMRASNGGHPILNTSPWRSGQGCPLLRASNDIHAPSKHAFSLFRDGG
jgi:hypothetical protein